MKNQLFTIAALMAFTTAGFAQNTATNNQVGDYQKASQTQAGTLQTSTVNQNEGSAQNYGNTTITIQTGTKANGVTVNQNNGSSSNFTSVTQTAGGSSGNTATISQSNNSGGGTPTAPATGFQQPIPPTTPPGPYDGNFVNLIQVGNNTATLTQDGGALGGSNSNVSNMRQYGSSNASITQSNNAFSNGAAIYQGDNANGVGNVNGNEASISQQGGMMGRSQGNRADVNQDKSGQTGRVFQENLSVNNIANIKQQGGNGTATITQIDNAQTNNAVITQYAGAGTNVAAITEKDNSHDNQGYINQYHDGSQAYIDQITETANNVATINQGSVAGSSSGNYALISQSNAYADGSMLGNTATIDQNTARNGGNNRAEVYQGKSAGSGSIARVVALGVSSENAASVSQDGSSNQSRLYQVGDKQKATITQNSPNGGNGNTVTGTALADFPNYATQYGTSNILTVTQSSMGANGVANTAAVFQYGTGNVSTFTQTGNSNN